MREDGTISKRGYCFANYSKFVRPGYHRVEATKNPTSGVYVSAYHGDQDVVVVAVNRETSQKSITVSIPGTTATSFEKFTTSGSKNLADEGALALSGGSLVVSLDAQSVTTLHGVEAGGAGAGGAGGSAGAAGSAGAGTGGTAGAGSTCVASAANAYQGVAATVPGKVEAEDFDTLGFSDSSATNEGGQYRPDTAVDIKSLGSGYAIGWMTAGEWLEYTVNVQTAGDYAVTFQTGSVDAGRTFSLSECGTELASVEVPQLAAWGEVSPVTATVHLEAGLQVLRLTVGPSDYLDLDSMSFELLASGGAGAGGVVGGAGSAGSVGSAGSAGGAGVGLGGSGGGLVGAAGTTSAGAAGMGGGAAGAGASPSSADSGCGCRASSLAVPVPGHAVLATLGLLGLLAGRRRGRRAAASR